MLNKRVTILFSEDQLRQLAKMAASENASIGALVRSAVDKVYAEEVELEQIRDAVDGIRKMRRKHPGIDYKALINEGRKY